VSATATASNGATANDTHDERAHHRHDHPGSDHHGSSSISIKKTRPTPMRVRPATDNIDGNLSSSVVKTGTVNTAVLGTYYVRYNVTDGAGNKATQKTRTVKVIK
jgi:G3E family GTPase